MLTGCHASTDVLMLTDGGKGVSARATTWCAEELMITPPAPRRAPSVNGVAVNRSRGIAAAIASLGVLPANRHKTRADKRTRTADPCSSYEFACARSSLSLCGRKLRLFRRFSVCWSRLCVHCVPVRIREGCSTVAVCSQAGSTPALVAAFASVSLPSQFQSTKCSELVFRELLDNDGAYDVPLSERPQANTWFR
jgi:hypothetical protein